MSIAAFIILLAVVCMVGYAIGYRVGTRDAFIRINQLLDEKFPFVRRGE